MSAIVYRGLVKPGLDCSDRLFSNYRTNGVVMKDFNLIEQFIKDFLTKVGIPEDAKRVIITDATAGASVSSKVLQLINNFMYVTDSTIGTNPENGNEFISKFHKFWKEHHEAIIRPVIDDQKCLEVAEALERIHCAYSTQLQSTKISLFTLAKLPVLPIIK